MRGLWILAVPILLAVVLYGPSARRETGQFSGNAAVDSRHSDPDETLLRVRVEAQESGQAFSGVPLMLRPRGSQSWKLRGTRRHRGDAHETLISCVDGRAEFVVDPAVVYILTTNWNHEAPVERREVEIDLLRSGEQREALIRLPSLREATWHGLVRDAQSGLPIEGAEVVLLRGSSDGRPV